MKNNVQSLANAAHNFKGLVEQARKFAGFKVPDEIINVAREAAQLAQTGEVEQAYNLLVKNQKDLSRVLRAFINNSPKHFNKILGNLAENVDEDLVLQVQNAIGIYTGKIGQVPGWNESAILYASMAHCFTLAQKSQCERKTLRQVEYQLRVQERQREDREQVTAALQGVAAELMELVS